MRYPVFAKSKSSGKIMLFVSRDEAVIIRFKRSELVNGNRIEDDWLPVKTNLHGKFFRMKRCRKYLTMID